MWQFPFSVVCEWLVLFPRTSHFRFSRRNLAAPYLVRGRRRRKEGNRRVRTNAQPTLQNYDGRGAAGAVSGDPCGRQPENPL